jgi:sensor histidine kinase regulating citrate/malate metabolism
MSFTIGLLLVVLLVFLVLGVFLVFLLVFIFFPSLIRALSNEVPIHATIIAHSFASSPWLFSFVPLESSSFCNDLVVVLDEKSHSFIIIFILIFFFLLT